MIVGAKGPLGLRISITLAWNLTSQSTCVFSRSVDIFDFLMKIRYLNIQFCLPKRFPTLVSRCSHERQGQKPIEGSHGFFRWGVGSKLRTSDIFSFGTGGTGTWWRSSWFPFKQVNWVPPQQTHPLARRSAG